jgi:antitoxin (DNA-binding transcriptional repressor) of toxin-antitoxin stability system
MARYSVATTKDNLSSLIDKALAGEEVIITRHGKPTVEMRVVEQVEPRQLSNADWMERLKTLRETLPPAKTTYLELKRMDEEEGQL